MTRRHWELVATLGPLLVLVGLPVLLGPGRAERPPDGTRRLTIITPHNELIRAEFKRAFEQWHRETYAEPVEVIWSVPGGTSVILRLLTSQFKAALIDGDPVGGQADMVFGGGTWVHGQLARPVSVTVDGEERSATISAPLSFDPAWLDQVYGENHIGNARLYDEQGHWFGLAMSGFGIVFNRDALEEINVAEPGSWADLTAAELDGWVAMADPTLSGSTATVFETVLQRRGWLDGWRILRRAGANARFFAGSSLKPPLEVSRGDAAMGMCIDFLGRSQAQFLAVAGERGRVGYLDPPGETSIDPDPISMLRGAPEPELARRFVEFGLSDRGQALWQFRAGEADGMGPQRYELRRLPVRRSMYERYLDRFIDQVDAYALVEAAPMHPHFRRFVGVLFGAMCIDTHEELREAWQAIIQHPAYPRDYSGIVTADTVDDPRLREMLQRFDAMPEAPGPDGTLWSVGEPDHLAAVAEGWSTPSLWPEDAEPRAVTRTRFAAFFREQYDAVVELGRH